MRPLHHQLYDESVPASIKEAQLTQQETPHRVERDSMGEVKVPREALFGAQTRRALDNFPISDLRFQRRFIQALGAIKLESANVNNELGLLDDELKDVIVEAAEEVVEGRLDNQFVLDIFQTGSGTSTNMNANEVDSVVKTGRTHLQDATPIRLGQEFHGYAGQIERGIQRVDKAVEDLAEVALGGTAVGTGVNTHPDFASRVCERLSARFGIEVRETENHFQAQSAMDAAVFASGGLKTVAVSLLKISNDIRWLGAGPRANLAEIALPEVQPGSSIMPGKVNPVIAESATMVAAQVIGNDATIVLAGQSGNFELNVMLPVIAYNLIQSIEILGSASANLADQCVSGLQATDRGPELVERGLMLATALAPEVGYDKAAEISKEAYKTGKTIREVARESTDLSEEELDSLLDARNMTEV